MIKTVSSITDLGVLYDRQLNFRDHYQSVVSKSNKAIFMLSKHFKFSSHKIKLMLYKTYILPIVNYASSVWNPTKVRDIAFVEKVQRHATKYFILRNSNLNYYDRISNCNLITLQT